MIFLGHFVLKSSLVPVPFMTPFSDLFSATAVILQSVILVLIFSKEIGAISPLNASECLSSKYILILWKKLTRLTKSN